MNDLKNSEQQTQIVCLLGGEHRPKTELNQFKLIVWLSYLIGST